MGRFVRRAKFALLLMTFVASASQADTKAGYDLWNRGDFAGAVAEWRPLAIAGDPVAQYDMAQAYQLGRGVEQDPKLAESWYAKAAAQGLPKARDNYGMILFQNGNRAAALPYIEESAARGEPRAQYVLATALFNGDMAPQDWVRAYALMTRASAGGIAAASISLAQMDKFIPLDQRQRGLGLAQKLKRAAPKPQVTDVAIAGPADARLPVEPASPAAAIAPLPKRPAIKPTPRMPVSPPSAGEWKVQLAALTDQGRVSALWKSLRDRIPALVPYRPYIATTGRISRLQAGPLPSRIAADGLCTRIRSAGQPCITIAPVR